MKITHYKNYRKRQLKYYRYFISYSYNNSHGGHGFGNVELGRYKKIEDIEDIKRWARNFEKEMNFKHKSLVVLSFQLF